jgi:formamidopyrimidine-DNA glycosylase
VPELPDVTVYVEALTERIVGHQLVQSLIRGPFLLRSVEPPVEALVHKTVREVRRLGKRIAIGFEGDLWLVLHLMIAGRLHWFTSRPKTGSRNILASFEFDSGFLTLTEAGSQHRASLHVVGDSETLATFNPGGIEVLEANLDDFASALVRENHTLKRALTDPGIFSGIGNAFSDEILHRAQLSPIAMTRKLTPEQVSALYTATRESLREWTARLRAEAAGSFPEKVTAFRDGMAVHGRYGKPCPRCGSPVQRIRYSSNETNYCARCQTNGKLLADRALSRLLREDWPKTVEELEQKLHVKREQR